MSDDSGIRNDENRASKNVIIISGQKGRERRSALKENC